MSGHKIFQNTVAVLFGGRSSEHDISLRSAVYVLKNFPEKYNLIPVGINKDGTYYSLEGTFKSTDFSKISPEDLAMICKGKNSSNFSQYKVVKSVLLPYRREILQEMGDMQTRILNLDANIFFPVLHGPNGEDGRLQGVFELAETAYVGCDIRASVIGIDKDIQKRLARDVNIPVAKYEVVNHEAWQKDPNTILQIIEKNIGFPCFVKPNALGSAVGVNRSKSVDDLKSHIQQALAFDTKALVEEPMVGTEVEVAFLGTRDTPRITIAGEIAAKDFYSYEAKYINDDGAAQFIPARLNSERMKELQVYAKTLATLFSLEGLCRIDFWNCHKTNRFVFNEINTLPGLTSISMFPKLWEVENVYGPQWIEELVERAVARALLTHKLQFGIEATL